MLSIAEEFVFTVTTEVSSSLTLGNVMMVASEGSMVLSDSMTVGVGIISVPELSLVVF